MQRIRLAFWVYLPLYVFLTTVQYSSGFLYIWSIDSTPSDNFVSDEWAVVIAFNTAKMLLASALCFAALNFSWQLKKIVKVTQEQYGEQDPGVKRTKMIFWFVRSLAITFFVSGLILNIIKPVIFLYLARHRDKHIDEYTWVKSWSILVNTAYQVVINLQQLMILSFYYRLDQRS